MRRNALAALAAALVALALPISALADGTETLGPPSIAVTPGPKVLAAGTGMHAFPNLSNSFSFTVPAGTSVRQVLLYWEGHHSSPAFAAGDSMISVNGNAVTGTLIGGPTTFFQQSAGPSTQNERFETYRADITSLGLVSAGPNTLTVNNMLFPSNFPTGFPFDQGNDGAGVLVVYDDGSLAPPVDIRDGNDLAYFAFASPLDTTVAQTFTFTPAPTPRSANLATLAGSVEGPDLAGLRPNQLLVTFDVGAPIVIQDPWGSNQGAEFDAANTTITIPANASSVTVQALSAGPPGSTDRPASLAWAACSISIEGGGEQICPPGAGFGGTFFTQVLPSGDVKLVFDQFTNFNDNSYGKNVVGWAGKAHKFGDLTGSDKAQFQVKNGAGKVVFDFTLDYITCDAATGGTPSKCDSRGALGGDGGVKTGNKAWILDWTTSLAQNLNGLGLCTGGNCTVAGTNLKVDSPPTLGANDYTLPAGSPFAGWKFSNVYEVTISKAAWGAAGFGGASVVAVHNSPAKPGASCPTTPGTLCAPGTKIGSLELKYTGSSCTATTNTQSGKVVCSGDPAGADPVRIVVTTKDGKKTYYDSFLADVHVGDSFTASAANAGLARFDADTLVKIYSSTGALLQTVQFHTSCSQPIAVGDKFGALEIVSGTSVPK